jgi:hypothetical protein
MESIRDFVFDLQTFSHCYHKILLTVLIVNAPNYLRGGYKFFFTHGFLKLFHTYFLEGEKTNCRKQVLNKMPKVCLHPSANFPHPPKTRFGNICQNVVFDIKSAI